MLPIAIYSFVPPGCRKGGAVSDRVAAAAPVRLACASRSLGRLALVAPTCLPAAASLSIYTILSRYTLTMLRVLTLRRRPAVTLSPARTPLEQRPLSPDVIAPLPWPAADQVAAAGAPSRSSSSITSHFTIRR